MIDQDRTLCWYNGRYDIRSYLKSLLPLGKSGTQNEVSLMNTRWRLMLLISSWRTNVKSYDLS
jgi:hypothetical protein